MIVCIIQARMGSTRLPGKVLKPILGKPMLVHQIERVQRAHLVDKIIIATTVKSEDDLVALTAHEAGVDCFRGDEFDVLDRYYQAAKEAQADIVIRLTGDCPLSDPGVIDETVDYFLKHANNLDYTSKPTNYPEGLDVEVFSFAALERSWKGGRKPSEREHVTPYIHTHPEIFRIGTWQGGGADFSKMHWSVDTPEDFIFATKIFEALYHKNPFFSKDDILEFLKNQSNLFLTNKGGTGYEGYEKSLKEDEIFQRKNFLYQKLIGFIPDVIFILAGGVMKEVGKDGLATYHSTKENEGDSFGILWGEARVIAAAELAMCFPRAEIRIVTTDFSAPNEPTQAEIIRDELEKLSISRDRIMLEEKSRNSTVNQISECLKIIYNEKWRRVAIVTNEYHIARVRAIYSHLEKIPPLSEEVKNIAQALLSSGVLLAFVGAESILPHRDKKYNEIIKRMQVTPAYKKRLKNEKKGTKMVISGRYSRFSMRKDDKLERKV